MDDFYFLRRNPIFLKTTSSRFFQKWVFHMQIVNVWANGLTKNNQAWRSKSTTGRNLYNYLRYMHNKKHNTNYNSQQNSAHLWREHATDTIHSALEQ